MQQYEKYRRVEPSERGTETLWRQPDWKKGIFCGRMAQMDAAADRGVGGEKYGFKRSKRENENRAPVL